VALGAITVCDRSIINEHELVRGGGRATEDIGAATGFDWNAGVVEFKLEIAVAMAQVEVGGQADRGQRQWLILRVGVEVLDVVATGGVRRRTDGT
jgi:hypothetical protein